MFYTTGEYLLNAGTLHELLVKSSECELLWPALCERARQSQAYGSSELPELDVDPALLTALLAVRDLE